MFRINLNWRERWLRIAIGAAVVAAAAFDLILVDFHPLVGYVFGLLIALQGVVGY